MKLQGVEDYEVESAGRAPHGARGLKYMVSDGIPEDFIDALRMERED